MQILWQRFHTDLIYSTNVLSMRSIADFFRDNIFGIQIIVVVVVVIDVDHRSIGSAAGTCFSLLGCGFAVFSQ